MENFQERFAEFKPVFEAKVQSVYDAYCNRLGYASKIDFTFEYQEGPKFVRIVKKESNNGGGSAFGFIDKSNGNLLKSAGWKAPAKNFARGNIFSEDFGLARMYWTGIQ